MQDLATVDITTSWLMINCTRRAGWVRVHQGPCNSTDHAQCRTCRVCPGWEPRRGALDGSATCLLLRVAWVEQASDHVLCSTSREVMA